MAKLLSDTRIYGTGTVDTQLFVNGLNSSISTSSGALVVTGGVGVGTSLWAQDLRTPATTIRLGYLAGGTGANGTQGVAIGGLAALTSQGSGAIAIGYQAAGGVVAQATRSIAIGFSTGYGGIGQYAIAIGAYAGGNGQVAGSIIIDATAPSSDPTRSNTGTYIAPIRTDISTSATSQVVYYNTSTKEITYAPWGGTTGQVTVSRGTAPPAFGVGAATTPQVVTFSATAMTVNCLLSNVFSTTVTANVTAAPTISNPIDGQTINWFITQDATGGRTMIWPTTFKWPSGVAGTLSAAGNAVDLLVATYRSATTSWYASLAKAFA